MNTAGAPDSGTDNPIIWAIAITGMVLISDYLLIERGRT